MKAIRFIGYAWCSLVVVGYLALWLTSEHGGGVLTRSGFGEIWLIALACLPGVGLVRFANSKTEQK